jgi:hypothetical protein
MIDPDLSYVPKKIQKNSNKIQKKSKKNQTNHARQRGVFFLVGWNGYHFFLI